MSDIWKEMWVKFCPKCECPIEKDGGCNFMKCLNCRFEFCWYCMQSTRNHDDYFCKSSNVHSCELIFIMIIGLLVRLTWISDVFSLILVFIFIKILTLMIGAISFFLIFDIFLRIYDRALGRNSQNFKKIFIFTEIIASIIIIISVFYFPYLYLEIFKIVLSIGLSFGICAVCNFALFVRQIYIL